MSPCGRPFCIKCQMETELKMVQENQTVTNENGATQSFIEADFDAIPAKPLRLVAQCLGFGRRKYGKENPGKISIEDHLSHAMNHTNEWRAGDRSEPHLVNAIARLFFALSQAIDTNQQPERYIHPDQTPPPETFQIPTNTDAGQMIMVRQNSTDTWVRRRFIKILYNEFECLTEIPVNSLHPNMYPKTTLWKQARLITKATLGTEIPPNPNHIPIQLQPVTAPITRPTQSE